MSLLGPIVKLSRALKERGLKGTITQLYLIGDLKFGELKGTDKFGNKYYEDNDLPYGQHRWVEYANIHDPDPTMIAPEWHGWMHHVFDETPNEAADYSLASDYAPAVAASHAIYRTHLGHHATSESNDHAQYNVSQYRQRGYNVGSLMTEPGEPDAYYKQPGHPLSADVQKGRFTHEKASKDAWNPQEELRKLKEKK